MAQLKDTVVKGSLRVTGSLYADEVDGTASKAKTIIDSTNGKDINITYGKSGQASTNWLASWNYQELGAISPNNVVAGKAQKLNTAHAIKLTGGATGTANFDGSADASINVTALDASKLTSGTVPIERIPKAALERLVVVADDTARFKLTKDDVQNGDTVKVTKTGYMYFVVDDTKLTSEAGYTIYTAGAASSVPWSGVTGAPTSFPANGGTASNVSGVVAIKNGGTGATDAAGARSNLGLGSLATKNGLGAGDVGALPTVGGAMTGPISYKGSKSTQQMIKWKDNTADVNGNGIIVGGGGLTVIGGGKSADAVAGTISNGGSEQLILTNDAAIDIYTNCQNGVNGATHTQITNDGTFTGKIAWTNVSGHPTSMPASDVKDWAKKATLSEAIDTGLTVAGATPVDDDYYISQYVGGGNTTKTYHKRPVSSLWNYIKGKISSVLGLTKENYGGKAATAGTADKANSVAWTSVSGRPGVENTITKTIPASGWSGTAAPYSYDLTSLGISGLKTDKPIVVDINGGTATAVQVESAMSASITGGSSTTIYAYGEKPTEDIPVVISYYS